VSELASESAGTRIRVMLADDHPVVRSGLRGMLAAEPDIEVAGEAGSGPEAVALARAREFDVILMDLRMPGGDGVAAIRELPDAKVVVLTTYDTDADILHAVEAGAAGYLLKDASAAELADAVRAAARGETVLAPSVAGRLVTRLRQPPQQPLSGREIEILALAARGKTNPEIGRELYISEATVKTHLLRAYAKLGVSSRTAAVTSAMERGLLNSGLRLTGRTVGEGGQQAVQLADERRRILQPRTECQRRLAEQDLGPLAEARVVVPRLVQPLDQRMVRVELKHRLPR